MVSIPLYRPYLSLEEVELILSTLPDQSSSLYKKLAELQIKIKYNLVKPATITKVRESVSESLGFSSSPEILQTTYDTLAARVLDGSITEVEKLQGAELEMKLFGFNSGMFE